MIANHKTPLPFGMHFPLVRSSARLPVLLLSLVVAFAANQVGAQVKDGRGYFCKVQSRGYGGWVPSSITFGFLENGTKALVVDSRIIHVKNGPITVAVKDRKNGNKRFHWALSLPTNQGREISVAYTLEFDPETRTGKIRANVAGFSGGRNSGELACNEGKFGN